MEEGCEAHQRMPASSSCMQTADLMVHGSPAEHRPACLPHARLQGIRSQLLHEAASCGLWAWEDMWLDNRLQQTGSRERTLAVVQHSVCVFDVALHRQRTLGATHSRGRSDARHMDSKPLCHTHDEHQNNAASLALALAHKEM